MNSMTYTNLELVGRAVRSYVRAMQHIRVPTMQPQVAKMLIKVPTDVKAWLEQQAARNISSQNAEIIRSVRALMDQEREQEKAAG
jgi:hypothetical protein